MCYKKQIFKKRIFCGGWGGNYNGLMAFNSFQWGIVIWDTIYLTYKKNSTSISRHHCSVYSGVGINFNHLPADWTQNKDSVTVTKEESTLVRNISHFSMHAPDLQSTHLQKYCPWNNSKNRHFDMHRWHLLTWLSDDILWRWYSGQQHHSQQCHNSSRCRRHQELNRRHKLDNKTQTLTLVSIRYSGLTELHLLPCTLPVITIELDLIWLTIYTYSKLNGGKRGPLTLWGHHIWRRSASYCIPYRLRGATGETGGVHAVGGPLRRGRWANRFPVCWNCTWWDGRSDGSLVVCNRSTGASDWTTERLIRAREATGGVRPVGDPRRGGRKAHGLPISRRRLRLCSRLRQAPNREDDEDETAPLAAVHVLTNQPRYAFYFLAGYLFGSLRNLT